MRDPRILGLQPPIGAQVALELSSSLIGRAHPILLCDWSDLAPAGGVSESETLRACKMLTCLSLLTFTQAAGQSVDIRRRLLRLSKHLKGRFGPRVSDGNVFASKEVGLGPA